MSLSDRINKNLLWFVTAIVSVTIAIPLIKQYSQTDEVYLIVLASICYLLLIISYIKIYENGQISNIYPTLTAFQSIIIVFVGALLFEEKLNTSKIMSILLAIVSLYLAFN